MELDSPEEGRIRKALDLAISTYPKRREDESHETRWRRIYLKIMRKRLDTLGRPEREVDENVTDEDDEGVTLD